MLTMGFKTRLQIYRYKRSHDVTEENLNITMRLMTYFLLKIIINSEMLKEVTACKILPLTMFIFFLASLYLQK